MESQKHAMIYGFGAVVCWSTVATAFKLSLQYLSPLQLMLVATVTSWILLFIVLIFQRRAQQLLEQPRRAYLHSLLFGALNPTLYYWLLLSAYDRLPAQEAQAINYSWAIVLSLLSVPLLKQRLSRSDVIAGLVCYSGVLVIATRGNLIDLHFSDVLGVALAIASTLIWSFYWIYARRDQREPLLGLCLNFTFAVPLIALICWLNGDLSSLFEEVAWQGLAGGLYVGIFEMGLAFLFWLTAMKRAVNTAPVANLIFMSPFLSLILISVFLRETIMSSTLLGLALIVSGLLVQQFVRSTGPRTS